ncbi:MAG: YccF domain-containing protein [Clostridia bacterium]
MLGNFYWKLFGGIVFFSLWLVVGTAFLLSVFGAPLAVKCFRLAYISWKPFGKEISFVPDHVFVSIVWFFVIGWALTLYCFLNLIISVVSIVGIPIAKQWLKVGVISLLPFMLI